MQLDQPIKDADIVKRVAVDEIKPVSAVGVHLLTASVFGKIAIIYIRNGLKVTPILQMNTSGGQRVWIGAVALRTLGLREPYNTLDAWKFRDLPLSGYGRG